MQKTDWRIFIPPFAILIYSLLCTLSFAKGLQDEIFLFTISSFPWSILFPESMGLLSFFFLIYIVNSIIIYSITATLTKSKLFKMPIVIALGIIPWSVMAFVNSIICTGKFCELVALVAIGPSFIFSIIVEVTDENKVLLYTLFVVFNFITTFLALKLFVSLLIKFFPRLKNDQKK